MAYRNEDEEEDDVPVCGICGGTPCEWEEFGKEALGMMETQFMQYPKNADNFIRFMDEATVSKSVVRKAVYKAHLGKGNRIPIPECVVVHIRDAYPENQEVGYMGFKESSNNMGNQEEE